MHAARFPTLEKIALSHLLVQGSLVASERAFSSVYLGDSECCGKVPAGGLGACSLLGNTVGGNTMEVMAGRMADDNQRAAWTNP